MQQPQPERHFPDHQQPITYRFASNRPAGQQANIPADNPVQKMQPPQEHKARRQRRRRRIFTWWNLFAVIGIITVIIQTVRYIIVPLLVTLNSLMGGAL